MALPVTLDDHVVQYINQTYNFDSDNQKLQLTSSGYYIQPILINSYLPIHKWKGHRSPPKLPYNHSVYRSILQFKWHYETFTMGERPEDSKEHTSVVDLCPLPNHITHLCYVFRIHFVLETIMYKYGFYTTGHICVVSSLELSLIILAVLA